MPMPFIATRISQLRILKEVSAREMSFTLGQNGSYINKIENGRALPSLCVLSDICDYFGITIQQFFEEDVAYSPELTELFETLSTMDREMIVHFAAMAKAMTVQK